MNTNSNSGRSFRIASHRSQRRTALSVLEFVGCVIAVVGGIWLGAIYLGVDLRRVAHEALTDAELLEKVPENLRPVGAEEEVVTREQLVATLREELSGLKSEITSLRSGDSGEMETTESTKQSADSNESYEKTLAYWNRLREIAAGEAALQADAASAFNDENAAKVFAIKSRISRFAAKAVDAVPLDGVDHSVVQFGRQLGTWYERAAELYDKAVHIWESTSAGSKTRTQMNEEWGRADLQHRNETRLIDEKASAVRSGVSRRFGQEFPEFVRPAADAAPQSETGGASEPK